MLKLRVGPVCDSEKMRGPVAPRQFLNWQSIRYATQGCGIATDHLVEDLMGQ